MTPDKIRIVDWSLGAPGMTLYVAKNYFKEIVFVSKQGTRLNYKVGNTSYSMSIAGAAFYCLVKDMEDVKRLKDFKSDIEGILE